MGKHTILYPNVPCTPNVSKVQLYVPKVHLYVPKVLYL